MDPAKSENRVNDALLGPLERGAIHWLLPCLPAWVTPNLLTLLGFLGSFIIFLAYVLTNYDRRFLWLASFGFAVNWLGDSLDGNLARYRKIERPRYGFFIDHSVDTLCEVFVFLGIGLSPYVDLRLALLALVCYLLLAVLIFIKTYVDGIFRISWAKFGPTEMRVIAVATNTIIYFTGNPVIRLPFGEWNLYNLITAAVTLLMFFAYVFFTISQAVRLAKIDPVHGGPVEENLVN